MEHDPVQEIVIELNVPVAMRDGTVLRANIHRPAAEGAYPILLSRSPYNKDLVWEGLLEFKTLVRAGYVVISQDCRGRFASDGDWIPWKYERSDSFDTVEWAAALPYSNRRVGMFGPSYLGSTQWSAALAGAPHLAAIAPVTTWSDPSDGLMFRGRALELGLNTQWTLAQARGGYAKANLSTPDLFAKVSATLSDLDNMATTTYWQLPAAAQAAVVSTDQPDIGVTRALTDPTTLQDSSIADRYDEIDVPSLNFAGWYDVFLQGSIDNYVGMRRHGRTARLILGPWEHATLAQSWVGGKIGEVNFGLGSTMPGGRTISDITRGWYDHWLKQLPATEEHESGVLLFVMGANQWRHEPDWPLSRATPTELYLDQDEFLSWTPPIEDERASEFSYDPTDPVPTRGGPLVMSSDYTAGPVNQAEVEDRPDVLVFTTEPLGEDLEITGRVSATLFASTDGPSTDWVVRLCEVDASGTSRNITDGVTRLSTEPGRIEEVQIDLWSTSILIRAGHRLRVHVTSSNFPRWDRNLNTGASSLDGVEMRTAHQRVIHDRTRPSRITLPLVHD